VPGTWQTYQPQLAAFPSDLAALVPGRGYWVNVSQVTQATLSGARWDASVALAPGWNLVGFPGLTFDSFETQELASVFGTKFGRVTQVWTFEYSAGSRFLGYDVTAIPALKELNFVKPGRGYWVYALEAVTIRPAPFVALQADSDASPLQDEEIFSNVDSRKVPGKDYTRYLGTVVRWAGTGDAAYDLNGNAILDSPYTQDTLRFEFGVDRKTITFGNTGEGTANWSIQNTIPWLFAAPFDAKDPTNTKRAKTANGTVSSDTDTVTLYVDRSGILPGNYFGQTVTIYTGSTARVIEVILDVPSSSGDWKGYASAARVNGKPIGIGKVDLFLNLFMESSAITETRFRAVLNRDLSLLFPRDVFMNGVF
jgi:hypothetical protein